MKLAKRILAIALVVGMIFSFTAMAFATPTYAVTATGAKGGYVTVSFIAKNATGFMATQTKVTYDKSVLSVSSITDGAYKAQYQKVYGSNSVMTLYNQSTAGTIIPGIILANKIVADKTFAAKVKTYNAKQTKAANKITSAVKVASLTLFTVKFKITSTTAKSTTVKWGSTSVTIPLKLTTAVKLGKVTNTGSAVKLTWTKLTGAVSYNVYRKAGTAKTWTKIASNVTTLNYTDKTVKSGTKYTYTVKGVCNSKESTKFNTTGLSITYLATPTMKSVTSAKTGITVKWAKVTGATGYIVYRKAGSGKITKIGTVSGNAKVTYVDKSATKKGTKYTYYVAAYKGKVTVAGLYNTTGKAVTAKYTVK